MIIINKQMRKYMILATMILGTLMVITACSKDYPEKYEENSSYPMAGELYIRFLSPIGTNILDSLNVCGNQGISVKTEDCDIKFTCVNTWNNANMDMYQRTAWVKIKDGINSIYKSNSSAPMEAGSALHYSWQDMPLFFDESHPNVFEYSYVISIHSPLIFKNNDIHTIKWFVWMNGGIHDAYKCEVDGKEYSLAGDAAVYNYWSEFWNEVSGPYGRVHDLAAQITINVE